MQISQSHWLILIDKKLSSILSPNKYCQATAAIEIKIKYQIGLMYSVRVLPKILILDTASTANPEIITISKVKNNVSPRFSKIEICGKRSSLSPACV